MTRILTILVLLLAASYRISGAEAATYDPRFGAEAVTDSVVRLESSPAMGHPRLFKGQTDYAGIVAAARSQRAMGFKALTNYLKRNALGDQADSRSRAESTASERVQLANAFYQERQLEEMAEASFAWYVTGDEWYLAEVKTRMRYFGQRVVAARCDGDLMQARAHAWYFALAYDFAYAGINASERQLTRDVIANCARASLGALPERIAANPRDGIAFHSLAKFLGALLIISGDEPAAHQWLSKAATAYVSNLSPWGGSDGGYANGTSYLLWDVGDSLPVWDLIDRVLDLPIYSAQWVSELPRFIAYTLPPGTSAGLFGDGAEVRRSEEWGRLGKAIMRRFSTPLARWYIGQTPGGDPARLHLLLSPADYHPCPPDPKLPPSALFADVGWAAMHSNLTDRNRVSVYFKNSSFGSFNHSHADQNSFVIFSQGEVLAMDSGYYDYYNSPHWRKWYKQTKAHNAITFDDGHGQDLGQDGTGTSNSAGRIARFLQDADYDLVVADAATAYGAGVSKALRTLVFIRPATVVVIDQLASQTPKKWEWHLHTAVPLAAEGASYRASFGRQEMCIDVAAPLPLAFSSNNGYPVPPASGVVAGPHVATRFSYEGQNRVGQFISVLRIGCIGPRPTIAFQSGTSSVTIPSHVISISEQGVTVSRTQAR